MITILKKLFREIDLRIKLFFIVSFILPISYHCLYWFGPNYVPKYEGSFDEEPSLIICEDVPYWLEPQSKEIKNALKYLEDKNVTMKEVRNESCSNFCLHGKAGIIPCNKGNIVIDWLPLFEYPNTVAVCFIDFKEKYSTIIVNSLKDFSSIDKVLILIHEIVHCREFAGHIQGINILGFKIPPRKGYIMNELVEDIGYNWHK